MEANHVQSVADLMFRLWPDEDPAELLADCHRICASQKEICFAAIHQDKVIGFIHLSQRTDYVEGCESSPVAYIEGIFVSKMKQKQGIGRMLVRTGEDWARINGLTEIGSDAELNNTQSHAFHLASRYPQAR